MSVASSTNKDRLQKLLLERALLTDGPYTLASGEVSDYFFDIKMVEVHSEGAFLVGDVLREHTQDIEFDAVGGKAAGAIPLTTSFVMSCHLAGRALEGFWVRDSLKDHGTQKTIEGFSPAGSRVLVLDDVITSGGSTFDAIDAVEAVGGTIAAVTCLVDRQAGARERFEARGYPFLPVFTKDELF